MKRQILIGAGAVVAAAGMIFAQAVSTPGAGTPHHPLRAWRAARIVRDLGLTDVQKQQAKTVFAGARQSAQPVLAQLKQNREALAQAVKSGNDAEIQQLSQNTGTLVGQLTAIRAQAMEKVYATLTPEQRTKADQLRERIRNRWQQRFGSGNHNS